MLAQLLAAVGATEPAPIEPSPHAGWPLLAVAASVGLALYAYAYRRRPGED